MRIIFITARMPFGADEAFLIAEAKALVAAGHDLVIVPRKGGGKIVNGDAENLLELTASRGLASLSILADALREVVRTPGLVLRELCVLISNGSVTTRLKNLLVFPKGLWIARLARERRAEHIHAHWVSTNSTMALIGSAMSGVPWSYTAHRHDITANNLLLRKTRSAAFGRYISLSGIQMAVEYCPELPREKLILLHLGVPTKGVAVNCAERSASDTRSANVPIIVCPARLDRVKGHKYLIDAVRQLRERQVRVRVIFAGTGPLREELMEGIRKAEISDIIEMVGHIPHDELVGMYISGQVTAVVVPSVDLGNHYHEGIPVSLIEAMLYCIPVVSTRTGGIVELLQNGAGLIVSPGDSVELADTLERLLRDDVFRQKCAVAGQVRVRDGWAVEAIASELSRLMLCNGSGRGGEPALVYGEAEQTKQR